MPYAIRAKVDTWFKTSTAQGSRLTDNAREFFKAGTTFPIMAYSTEGSHLRVTLGKDKQGQQIFIKGRNTWYLYEGAIEILQQNNPIYEIRAKVDTWFKASAAQGSSLPLDQKEFYKAGTTFPIVAYKTEGNHLKITLGQDEQGQQLFIKGRNTWYLYEGAIDLLYGGQVIAATLPPAATTNPPTKGAGAALSNAIPNAGIELIKTFEGYGQAIPGDRAKAYADPIKGWAVPTIGYGTTAYPDGSKVKWGDIITRDEAERYLVDHIEHSTRPFLEKIPTWGQMNSNQRAAIYSFAYNLGAAFYGRSDFQSITRLCDSPERWTDKTWVKEQFVKYRNPGSAAEAGLRRRREAEADLFCS